MSEDDIEPLKRAVNALEHLRQAKQKLPQATKGLITEAREHLHKADWPSAKASLVKILESETTPPEELWVALVDVLDAANETDIKPLLEYIDKGKPKPQ